MDKQTNYWNSKFHPGELIRIHVWPYRDVSLLFSVGMIITIINERSTHQIPKYFVLCNNKRIHYFYHDELKIIK